MRLIADAQFLAVFYVFLSRTPVSSNQNLKWINLSTSMNIFRSVVSDFFPVYKDRFTPKAAIQILQEGKKGNVILFQPFIVTHDFFSKILYANV